MKFFGVANLFSEIKTVPDVLAQKTFPSLNGLRGISILMVVGYHIIQLYNIPVYGNPGFMGPLGVDIFFVISGFLITTLCVKEKVKYGSISLKAFYMRRVLRIVPVAYLYIITLIILNQFYNLNIFPVTFLASFLFIMNLSISRLTQASWYLGHYWSLSVEEQFYLFFPVLLNKSWKLFIAILLFTIFAVPVIYYFQINWGFLNYGVCTAAIRYFIKFQGIAIGCLYSVMLFKGYFNFHRLKLPITLLSIFAMFYLRYSQALNPTVITTNLIISLFVGFIVVNNLHQSKNWIFSLLNTKVLSFIGILSYSIYIWQELFLANDPNLPLSHLPMNLILLVVVPLLSYFYFEKFFLKFKKRFQPVKENQ
nr:acyltransferase [uncultured Mucilaginibacter sp.]